jgi:hypothetical protein
VAAGTPRKRRAGCGAGGGGIGLGFEGERRPGGIKWRAGWWEGVSVNVLRG